ncbi:hypothetical protein K458DRAFT_394416 [Lentithecium fluviatile CBS 122367]|uniref:Uncharacterized protein n=1 Tax=Lentithecium fluviatile CBS 122367 TaxID=1168545 RepID=A0A6G1IL89_9PLEO|nr:hypothetical protein K458DRAFT_394416 [Lentithecium fluviatile CBS 122367]
MFTLPALIASWCRDPSQTQKETADDHVARVSARTSFENGKLDIPGTWIQLHNGTVFRYDGARKLFDLDYHIIIDEDMEYHTATGADASAAQLPSLNPNQSMVNYCRRRRQRRRRRRRRRNRCLPICALHQPATTHFHVPFRTLDIPFHPPPAHPFPHIHITLTPPRIADHYPPPSASKTPNPRRAPAKSAPHDARSGTGDGSNLHWTGFKQFLRRLEFLFEAKGDSKQQGGKACRTRVEGVRDGEDYSKESLKEGLAWHELREVEIEIVG